MLIHQVEGKENQIAITFDDGPNPVYTPEIMGILREYDAKATFFMIGEQIDKFPEIARAVFEAGHEIGNHTLTHANLTTLKSSDIRNELARTEERIMRITGAKPVSFRPPYFAVNDTVAAEAEAYGYRMIGAANTAAQDWEEPGVEHIVEKSLESVAGGCILIFHDGFGNRSQTVEALRRLLPMLKGKGYIPVRSDELVDF